jgi:hypothetical protein
MVKSRGHTHYWIKDERLHETYDTLRGLRYIFVKDVPGLPDTEECPEDMLLYIRKEFFE